jgi:hypothetical protein
LHVSDVFQEVDEELRRDRAAQLWNRYGNYVIGAAVAIVVGTGAFVAWRDYQNRQAAEQGARFFEAAGLATAGEAEAGTQALAQVAQNAASGYALLARMREAALKAQAGDRDAAAAIYRQIAGDGAAPKEIRDAATLLAALQSFEKLEPAELERQLAALREDRNPWRHSAIEAAALIAARAGEAAKARELYTKIADDPTAPAGLRARAAEMIAVLGT